MKKNFKTILALVLIVCMILPLTACSIVPGLKGIIGKVKNTNAGTYYGVSIDEYGEVTDLTELEEYGMVFKLILDEGGTFEMGFYTGDEGDELDIGTWDINKDVITLSVKNAEEPFELVGTVKDGVITIDDGGVLVVFDKNHVPAEPNQDYIDLINGTGEESENSGESSEQPSINTEDRISEKEKRDEERGRFGAFVTPGGSTEESGSSAVTTDADVIEIDGYRYKKDDNGLNIPVDVKYPITVYNENGLFIEITGMSYDNDFDAYVFDFHMKNSTQKAMTVSANQIAVNRAAMSTFIWTTVEPNTEATDQAYVYFDEMRSAAVTGLDNLIISLYITDDTYSAIFDGYKSVTLANPNVSDAYEVADFGDSSLVLFDTNEAACVAFSYFIDEYQNFYVYTYLINKSDRPLYFDANGFTINGTELDPFWSDFVAPGCCRVSRMEWYEADVKASNLAYSGTWDIKFKMDVSYYDDYTSIYSGDCELSVLFQ